MLSLNPVDWLELGVRVGFDAFEKGMTRLAEYFLSKIPRRRRRRFNPR